MKAGRHLLLLNKQSWWRSIQTLFLDSSTCFVLAGTEKKLELVRVSFPLRFIGLQGAYP
jgi:hypothetical protein